MSLLEAYNSEGDKSGSKMCIHKVSCLNIFDHLELPLCSHFAFYDENEKVVPMTSQLVSTLFLPSTLIDHLCHISCV